MDTSPRERPPAPTRIPALGAEQLLAHPRAVVIDLRSPGEYAEDHVPGSVNVPLFDDDERALVGVLYNHASPERAFREGLEVVLAKVDALVERIAQAAGLDVSSVDLHETVRTLASGGMTEMERRLELVPTDELGARAVVVHCWRGGLRSQSVSALLRAVGLCDAAVLDGGYKAYRAQVREELLGWDPPPAYVLRGLTGVGKTLVLRELEGQRPGWTMDLEAAAGHRSSLLGMVGLEPVPQKTFESRLAERIRRGLGADRRRPSGSQLTDFAGQWVGHHRRLDERQHLQRHGHRPRGLVPHRPARESDDLGWHGGTRCSQPEWQRHGHKPDSEVHLRRVCTELEL